MSKIHIGVIGLGYVGLPLALTYAEVPYKTLWDREVFNGELQKYDWLHLHHEDFTGQYGKFYKNYHTAQWYIEQKKKFESMAKELGFLTVHEQKKALTRLIRSYVGNGGFLFAMCSATDTYDIALAEEGIEVEIIDPRTLLPFDMDTVIQSAKKTNRIVIVHEAVKNGGIGAEISAQIQEQAFDYLDAPVTRVAAPFAPVPFSPALEQSYVPNAESIADGVRDVLHRNI